MDQPPEDPRKALGNFRELLRKLAQDEVGPRLRSKLDPSDLVQATLTEAFAHVDQFQGQNDADMEAWLRAILRNIVRQELRKYLSPKRDVARERPLEPPQGDSAAGLAGEPAADQSTPGHQAMRQETAARLAQALEQLPTDQRTVVQYRELGYGNEEIAALMNRTVTSVAGLYRRGLQTLRRLMAEDQ